MATLSQAVLSAPERAILDRLTGLLQTYFGERLDAVWLYGSRARGDVHGESDIDLLVIVTEEREEDPRRVLDLVEQAAAGPEAVWWAVTVGDRAWLAGRREIRAFFVLEVERDRIVVWERP